MGSVQAATLFKGSAALNVHASEGYFRFRRSVEFRKLVRRNFSPPKCMDTAKEIFVACHCCHRQGVQNERVILLEIRGADHSLDLEHNPESMQPASSRTGSSARHPAEISLTLVMTAARDTAG